jgi:tRNA (guanine26-N2/guanine27-N2)-dimethyltransferase
MSKTYHTQLICEGNTQFFIPKQKLSSKGPSSRGKAPFYNPAMILNRDLSLLVAQWLINSWRGQVRLLDGLAASGVRGIRMAKELEGDFTVIINDCDEQARCLIEENVARNNVDDVVVVNKDLNQLLSEERYQYIDIDPFGSPVYFVDAAVRSIVNNGVIACTATDTATLCGVYPRVCRRRYGAMPFHSFIMKEIGLRILLDFIGREAVKYDKGIEPLVCHVTDHYFRVYVRIRNGVRHANESVDEIRCVDSNEVSLSSTENVAIGPLWMGRLHKKRMVQELRTLLFEKNLPTKHELWKLLSLLEEEADAPAFFYTTENFASALSCSPPKMKTIFDTLKSKGYTIARTHFTPTGFKTDAPRDEIKGIL